MALDWNRTFTVTLPTNHRLVDIAADDTNIYAHVMEWSNSLAKIITYSKADGSTQNTLSLPKENTSGSGIAIKGDNLIYAVSKRFAGATRDNSPNKNPKVIEIQKDGTVVRTYDEQTNADDSNARGFRYGGTIQGLEYIAGTPNLLFMYQTPIDRIQKYEFKTSTQVHLPGANRILYASGIGVSLALLGNSLWHTNDKFNTNPMAIERDLNLALTGTTQALTNVPNNSLSGIAASQGQLITCTSTGRIDFFGEVQTPTPSTPTPTPRPPDSSQRTGKQLFLNSPYYQAYDVAKVQSSGAVETVRATNTRMLAQTELSLTNPASAWTIRQQLSNIRLVPEFNIPTAEQGDKIFLNTTGNTAPTKAPSTGVLSIEGIITVGKSQRQTFVCSQD